MLAKRLSLWRVGAREAIDALDRFVCYGVVFEKSPLRLLPSRRWSDDRCCRPVSFLIVADGAAPIGGRPSGAGGARLRFRGRSRGSLGSAVRVASAPFARRLARASERAVFSEWVSSLPVECHCPCPASV